MIRIARAAGRWYGRWLPVLALFLVGLLLFLLFGGGRIAAVGQGLGQGVRHLKRALGSPHSDSLPPPTPTRAEPSPEPKLLPAKGESSAPKDDPS